MSEFTFSCPHCQHTYADAFELLDTDELHHIHCEHCSESFYLLLKECNACRADSVFNWPKEPDADHILSLTCTKCNAKYEEDGGDEEEEY